MDSAAVAAEGRPRSPIRRVMGWGWPARFPIVQFPNPPLIVALAASVASGLTGGDARRASRAVFYLAITVWAYEEARRGDNWLRRALGCAFLLYLAFSLAGEISR